MQKQQQEPRNHGLENLDAALSGCSSLELIG